MTVNRGNVAFTETKKTNELLQNRSNTEISMENRIGFLIKIQTPEKIAVIIL